MRPEGQRPELRLSVPVPGPASSPDRDGDTVPADSTTSLATPAGGIAMMKTLARATWSMRLHALLGEEITRAVDADILTVGEAEVLMAQLAVAIDHAVGAAES
jgi:hypothetical protein